MSIKPGDRFGRLTVISEVERSRTGKRRYKCNCVCGGETIVFRDSLRSGNTKSCGCLNKELASERRKTHGQFGTPLYRVWANMKERCNRPEVKNFHRYGGRGISYHPSFETFEGFLKGIPDGYKPKAGLELDRIDNDGNYEPGNLRWVTKSVQAANKSTNRYVRDPKTEEMITHSEFARRYNNVSFSTMRNRLSKGLSGDELLSPPKKAGQKRKSDEEVREIKQLLWSYSLEDVSALTGLSTRHLREIRDRKIYDEVSEFR